MMLSSSTRFFRSGSFLSTSSVSSYHEDRIPASDAHIEPMSIEDLLLDEGRNGSYGQRHRNGGAHGGPMGEAWHTTAAWALDTPIVEEETDYRDSLPPDFGSEHGMYSTENPMPGETTTAQKKKTPAEILHTFDPQKPPDTDDLQDLQLWLECEAQQECVRRYSKVLDEARARGDYSSLSFVQKQVMWWFEALTQAFESRQEAYILKKKANLKERKIEEGEDAKEKTTCLNRYGPFLCALTPSKLAVIAAHTAIMHAITTKNAKGGVAFASLAEKLGEAVEEEVIIQRVLHTRFLDEQRRKREAIEDIAAGLVSDSDNSATIDPDKETAPNGDALPSDVERPKWIYAASHLQAYLDEVKRTSAKRGRLIGYALRRARQILENEDEWTRGDKVHVGAVLIQDLLNHASVKLGNTTEPAFTYEKRWGKKKLKSWIHMNSRLEEMIISEKFQSFAPTTTRQKPMIVPPKLWVAPRDGGYFWLKTDVLRHHGCHLQTEVLQHSNLSTIYDGLNALGRVPWKINNMVLNVAQRCWDENIPLGDIPQRDDFDVPEEPIKPSFPNTEDKETPEYQRYRTEMISYHQDLARYERVKQKNRDLCSLRCSALLKLNQAFKFKDFDQIYFPYNMDFRGRAYPCTPHLSTVGSDLCRGLLIFADSKPLGDKGLYWLKVHLANLAGKDKLSFDDRAAYIDSVIDDVRDSTENPIDGDRWWMSNEDPFQSLSVCVAIVEAIDSGHPESYMCSVPVHMDGSCNGLQHYAALGRDLVGGKAVNLCASAEKPVDVYSGVTNEVVRRVAEEAARSLDFDISDPDSLSNERKKELRVNKSAKLVDGLIDRGVVKRTVMTSVYGVTYMGARQQITEKIEEKLADQGVDIDAKKREIFYACGYIATVTMNAIGELFTGAQDTMSWLTTCARMISQRGHPVAWITPIGLPVTQPYRRKKMASVTTLMQTVILAEKTDDLPVNKSRQVSAFPPNFIHSLDSSHMLFTALEMDRRGLAFSAVHDSFWTHPCDVDEMNEVLRDTFIQLYNEPLLENQKKSWEMRYPDVEFPDVPERGTLDLEGIRHARYFFQ